MFLVAASVREGTEIHIVTSRYFFLVDHLLKAPIEVTKITSTASLTKSRELKQYLVNKYVQVIAQRKILSQSLFLREGHP